MKVRTGSIAHWCKGARFLGVSALKNPLDWWVYQEIIAAQRPDWIVEIGVYRGGALLSYAFLCDAVGHGRVIGVDPEPGGSGHPRVTKFDLADDAAFPRVREMVGDGTCLVIEDSSHEYFQCRRVLETYGTLVKSGGYLVVEDTPARASGPRRAIDEFLPGSRFEIDHKVEPPYSSNPGGYLRAR